MNDWPEDGLESVLACPVCSSLERALLHEDLTDVCFSCAPGKWKMFKCHSCGIAYLDPRPNAASIHLAYADYFTHSSAMPAADASWLKRFWQALAKGYRHWRFASRRRLQYLPGFLLVSLLPGRRRLIDAQMRHLPRPRAGQRLLDVGCGNGDFLRLANQLGWLVSGVDFDPHAVQASRVDGLDVRLGGLERLTGQEGQFDVITLSHVIEHVHDPRDLLRGCQALLKKGGLIWIDTPNLESQGYKLFGAFWRGLEVPRHLSIFCRDALIELLYELQFQDVRDAPYRPLCKIILSESEGLAAAKLKPLVALPLSRTFAYLKLEREAKANVRSRELITLIAFSKGVARQEKKS